MILKGNQIYLRAIEKKDLDFLYTIENDLDVWEISGTITPYSRDVLQRYLDNAHRDIYDVKQLRMVISNHDDEAIGLIDLFEFEPYHLRAGLGIIITNPDQRNKGIGAEAIRLVCNYAFDVLNLKQLYANILEDNLGSIHLFEKLGFEKVGLKKNWIRSGAIFKNEFLLQKIQN